jgi:hypothetical protein
MTTKRVFNAEKWGIDFPRADDGRMLKVYRVYRTEYSMGQCGCCEADAHYQIVMFDPIRKDEEPQEKTTLFACHRDARLFVEDYHQQADRKVKAWDDGWEVVCDFCGEFCASKPYVHKHTPLYDSKVARSEGEPRDYTHAVCDPCYMDTLFI